MAHQNITSEKIHNKKSHQKKSIIKRYFKDILCFLFEFNGYIFSKWTKRLPDSFVHQFDYKEKQKN